MREGRPIQTHRPRAQQQIASAANPAREFASSLTDISDMFCAGFSRGGHRGAFATTHSNQDQ